jgi:hypothetical protein
MMAARTILSPAPRDTGEDLDAQGYATIDEPTCRALTALYSREDGFRTRVVMSRHGSEAANIGIRLPITDDCRRPTGPALRRARADRQSMERATEASRALP